MEKVKTLTFRLSKKQLTRQDINDFEENSGIKLPEDFINHYLQFNGGFPNANWSNGIKFNLPLFYFFPIKHSGNTVEKILQELKLTDLLPFAMNKIMRYFCLGTGKDNYGKIFYFAKGAKAPKPDIRDALEEIELHCGNFSEFIQNLQRDNLYGKERKPQSGLVENFEAYIKSGGDLINKFLPVQRTR
jgi:hypothetical protein